MPIYEYKCSSCGFQKEYLQKVSDPRLTDCPECGKATFQKMLTAAGFQLKGGGWYVTDFRDGGSKPAATAATPAAAGEGAKASGESKSESGGESKTTTPAATPAPAPAAAPAASASGSGSGS